MKEVEEIRGQQETYDTTLTRFVYSPLSWLQLRNSLLMDFKDVETHQVGETEVGCLVE